MNPTLLLTLYCLLIVAASLAGGWLPGWMRLTHTRMQLMMSFVAGLMLGVGILHLLPHSVAELGSIDGAVRGMLFGLLLMFFLIRIFHFHQHGPAASGEACDDEEHDHPAAGCSHHDHAHHDHAHHDHAHHDHADHHHHHGDGAVATTHHLSGFGVAFGLALHTLIDGVALAASVAAEAHEADAAVWGLFGVGTFLAVALHKPLDALSITTLMAAGGWSVKIRQIINASFALMCPLGALFFYFGLSQFGDAQHLYLGYALAFSAGVFVCISLGDLLPELSFHTHDRAKLSTALLLGVALAYGIGFLEPAHTHAPKSSPADAHEHRHDHAHEH